MSVDLILECDLTGGSRSCMSTSKEYRNAVRTSLLSERFCRNSAMSSAKAAMILLVGCLLLTPSPRAVKAVPSSERQAQTVSVPEPGCTHGAPLPTSGPSRPASLAQFSPWRYRLKSVLEETDSRIIEEADLGPAPSPSRLIRFLPIECLTCRPLATPPLRC